MNTYREELTEIPPENPIQTSSPQNLPKSSNITTMQFDFDIDRENRDNKL